jgi:hypothetical protein
MPLSRDILLIHPPLLRFEVSGPFAVVFSHCFWNKRTFCGYALNRDGPTATSRTMDAVAVVSHLQDARALSQFCDAGLAALLQISTKVTP